MKKYMIILIMCCLTLVSSTCENGNDTHYYIIIQNQSDKDIDMCSRSYIPFENLCALIPEAVIKANSKFEFQPFNSSIEKSMETSSVLELYFINNRQAQGFYDCDSIYIKNDILAYYTLTLDDLRRMNWTVVYPLEE
ncbi:hypothetical protein LJC68_02095 [Bacteroidales bacterium OttesenSCG-928-B11]|nr:hypothetical protein [Bacteroidales bacterium OttesenSCG-928-C03]MDL2311652.1 hypothetical protein [Bacteroidales bacterium OttesenSCG-928-B11]